MSSIFCGSRTIDLLDWNSLLDDRAKISDLLVVPNVEVSATEHDSDSAYKTGEHPYIIINTLY